MSAPITTTAATAAGSAAAAAPARTAVAPPAQPAQAPKPAALAVAAAPVAAPAVAVPPVLGVGTPKILELMLKSSTKISDLFFSPGRPPLVEVNGKLMPVIIPGAKPLIPDDTRRIASDLIGQNKHALAMLRDQGSCDVSYSLPGMSRFRVNVFMQRGTCVVVMRVIPSKVPSFEDLNLPEELKNVATLLNGIVLVTGPTASGKSSTLAAIIDKINQESSYHVLTIEDPIEFLHSHKNCIIHQRELHADTPSFALALRAALRQAPKVILVGEMRDRETIEIAMEAAETGH